MEEILDILGLNQFRPEYLIQHARTPCLDPSVAVLQKLGNPGNCPVIGDNS